MMKTNLTIGFLASGVLLLALAVPTATAQDAKEATEAAKKAAETIFKDPRIQGLVKSVKDNPDAAMKKVSNVAREQMSRVKGGTTAKNSVPATRAELPGLPPAPVKAKPAPAPQMQIPEPVARGQRPAPPVYTQVKEPALTNPSGVVPAPRVLAPRYTQDNGLAAAPKKAAGAEEMEIDADESIMDQGNNIMTFMGNVVVQHPSFHLIGEKLVIYMNEEGSAEKKDAPPFKKAIATGGMVVITRIGIDGKKQVAKSRKADYNAASGDIVLTGGPPTLQSGGGFVNPKSRDAVIILKGTGRHEVKGGGGRVGFKIPMKGGSKTIGGSLGGDLNSMKNKKRNP